MKRLVTGVMGALSLGLAGLGLGCSHAQSAQSDQDRVSEAQQDIQDIRRGARRDVEKVNEDAKLEKSRIAQRADDKVLDERRKIADEREERGLGGSGANVKGDNTAPAYDNSNRINENRVNGTNTGRADEHRGYGSNEAERRDARGENRDVRSAPALTGTLASCSSNSLTVRDFNGAEVKLKTDESTRVLQHGLAVKLKDFKEGTELKTNYVMDGNDKIAREVWVMGGNTQRK